MRVAVSGGTGIAGRFIVEQLQRQGCQVTLLAREDSDIAGFSRPVDAVVRHPTPLTCSAQDLAEIADSLFDGADAFVHAAFDHVSGRYRHGEGDDLIGFVEANLSGSIRLIEAARHRQVPRVILLSSRAVFSANLDRGLLDEEHPVHPDTHYGAVKAGLEAFVRSYCVQNGLTISAIRATGIYGRTYPLERTKWYALIKDTLQSRGDLPVRSGTEVHGDDLGRAVWLLLGLPPDQVAGEIFNCSDLYLSTRQIADMVQEYAGVSGPLPDEVFDPDYPRLDCQKLRSHGFRFGGEDLLKRTVNEIVDLVR